MKESECAV